MSALAWFYLACAVVCFACDVFCGWIAGSKQHLSYSVICGLLWPLYYPFIMFASAVIIARMRHDQLAKEPT